jgi:hypothetical protein
MTDLSVKIARATVWTESEEGLMHSIEVALLEEGSGCPHSEARLAPLGWHRRGQPGTQRAGRSENRTADGFGRITAYD